MQCGFSTNKNQAFMVFSSNIYLLYFLPLFIMVYFITPTRFRNYTLLLFSIVFYAYGAPNFVPILILTCIANYYLALAMSKAQTITYKKIWCGLSIAVSLTLLLYFKYANFIVENINGIIGIFGGKTIEWMDVLLPIGISFFTFQSISYTVDVYRSVAKPARNPLNHLLYIIMFPQLIAGPIVKYNSVSESIVNRNSTFEDKVTGLYRFSIGLSKKVLISNFLGAYVDNAFSYDLSTMSSLAAWIGMFAYTFQIYFDFSGYSDMAIGLGKMMGFKFPENFDNPYNSKSISEFWRRWHITLGKFMKDYLYIPLGGNRVGKARKYFNLIIVFLLSGLWHGASYTFILWGIYHGLFIVLDKLFMLKILKKAGSIPSVILTFLTVAFGWVLFRADSITDAANYYHALFSFNQGATINTEPEFVCAFVMAIFFSFVALTKVGEILQNKVYFEPYTIKKNIIVGLIAMILFILSVGSLLIQDFNPFIYFRF